MTDSSPHNLNHPRPPVIISILLYVEKNPPPLPLGSQGLLLLDSAQCTISDSEIQGMHIGIVASKGSQAKIVRPRVYHMAAGGVVIRGKGTKVTCVEAEIFGNSSAGIEVADGANAALVENSIQNNGGPGVLVQANCYGSMARNNVIENTGGKVVSHAHERKFVIG